MGLVLDHLHTVAVLKRMAPGPRKKCPAGKMLRCRVDAWMQISREMDRKRSTNRFPG